MGTDPRPGAAVQERQAFDMKTILRQFAAAALCLFLCTLCLPQAYAYTPIPDTARSCTLTLKEQHPGLNFSLYQVATVQTDAQGNVTFRPTQTFASCPVSLYQTTAEGWRGAAGTLSSYIAGDSIPAYRTGKVGSNGTLTFSNLPQGLYLVLCRETYTEETENGTVTCRPMENLICLPNWLETSTGQGQWVYDVSMVCKIERSDDEYIYRVVLKRWRDNGNAANKRPSQITVDLLRDGVKYGESVTLSEANGWTHTWSELENGHNWQIVERNVPDGYRVSISLQGVTFMVTNTYTPTNPGNPSDPSDPDDPPGNDPDPPPVIPPPYEIDEPDVPLGPPPEFDPYEPPPSDEDEIEIDEPDVPLADLPQTGQLWWPVPLLSVAGMFLFILGWALRRRSESYGE